ncbi:hypothetical protein QQ045_031055 [Rhodiola kirilowii]
MKSETMGDLETDNTDASTATAEAHSGRKQHHEGRYAGQHMDGEAASQGGERREGRGGEGGRDLARVSADGVVVFAGLPGQQRAKTAEVSKFGRPAKLRSSSWWVRFFVQTNLEENESAIKKMKALSIGEIV